MIELGFAIMGIVGMVCTLWGVWLGATIVDRTKSGQPLHAEPEPVFEEVQQKEPDPMPKDKR